MNRHTGESRYPDSSMEPTNDWTPAFAGVTIAISDAY
jgi:hypothetical protein